MRNTIIIVLAVVFSGVALAFLFLWDEETPQTVGLQTEPGTAPSVNRTVEATATEDENKSKAAAKPSASDSGAAVAAKPLAPAGAKTAALTPEASTKKPDSQGLPALTPPTFDIVRIAKDRTAVIAGRAPAGSTVRLTIDGKVLAEAPASHRGEWVAVVDKPLPSGQAELDIVATMPDGRTVGSETIVALLVPGPAPAKVASAAQGGDVDTVRPAAKAAIAEAVKEAGEEATVAATKDTAGIVPAPAAKDAAPKMTSLQPRTALAVLLPKSGDAPARLLQKPEPRGGPSSNKLSVDTVDYDDKGNVIVSGSAPPGAKVRTYVDNKPVGISQADMDKTWRLKPVAPIAAGAHTLRVDQVDLAGRVVSRVELPFVRVAVSEILAITTASYRVIVQPGNSLWRIARRVYGSGNRYTVIYQANDGQIRDPDMIFPGQVFNLPAQN